MQLAGKRLMILGAGPFQAPAIHKAADLGCYVITVDYLPDNVGHKYGHQYVNSSTADKEKVLLAAKSFGIDGICTFSSDMAVSTVAYVNEQLGLVGISQVVAETMGTKHRFRAFLRNARLSCPAFRSGDSYDAIAADIHHLNSPIIFKPVDTSGSRGITRLDQIDPMACKAAFLKARGFSRSNTACVEEFVTGIEVGGDAIVIEGRIAFIAITHKHLDGFVVSGHSLPANVSRRDRERIIEQIETICCALGYEAGPLNFDAIVSADDVTVLEISARNGGNGIPAVIERATGVDVESASIALALGEKPSLPKSIRLRQGAGSFVFGSLQQGVLIEITGPEVLKLNVPEVFDVCYAKQPGDHIEPFEHNGNLIGFALFDCTDAEDYDRVVKKISSTIRMDIQHE